MFRNKRIVNLLAEIFGFSSKFDHGGDEVEYNCPHCDNRRNKFNMAVNTDLHIFHCWACGYKGKIDRLLRDYGNERQNKEWDGIRAGYVPTDNEDTDEAQLFLTGFRSLKVKWSDSLTSKAAIRYLRERGIGSDLIDKWDICYAEDGKYMDRIIIPSKTVDGKLEYFVARDIFDTQKLKYKNPSSRKEDVIFGEKFVDFDKPVVITEGAFDAMVLYNAVPLLGSKIEGHTKLLKKIFKHRTPIILGFDDDKAGKDANLDIGRYLLSLGVPLYSIQGNEYGDLAKAFEMRGRDYIVKLIRNAQPFDEMELLINDLRP